MFKSKIDVYDDAHVVMLCFQYKPAENIQRGHLMLTLLTVFMCLTFILSDWI